MKKTFIIILAICLLPLFSCSAIIESQMDYLSDELDDLGDELDDLGDELDDLGDELDDLFDDLDSSNSITVNGINYSVRNPKIKISKNDRLKVRKFKINDYTSLNVGYSFQVVMCDTIDSVTVHINEKLDKYLVVKVKNGTLTITLDRIGSISCDNAKFGYVYIPYNPKLNSFSLNGTSCFATLMPINVTNFNVDLSGASSFKAKVHCTKYKAELSGTAYCRTDIKCKQADIELNGASKHSSNIECTSLDADLSGTALLKGNITTSNINAQLHGASKMEMAGKSDKLTVDVSGTGELSCKKLKTKVVSGDMSGASKAVISCSDHLSMDITGTSHLLYYGNPKTDIDASRATTVERKGL